MREQRLEMVTKWLKEKDTDAAFIHSAENVFYLTNFLTDPHERLMGLFVFKDSEPFFICPGMETSQAKDAGWGQELIGYGDHEDPWEIIQKAIHKRSGGKALSVAVEKDLLSYSRAENLMSSAGASALLSIEELMNGLRLIKDEKEISILEKAAELADFGVKTGVEALKEGISEMDVIAEIEYQLKRKGVSQMSFSTMVLFGEKSGQPHGNPGLETLKKGDLVLFDLGVVLDGYCSDITRTVAFDHINDKQKEIYDTCLKANQAALDASKPGTRIGDLDLAARKVIEDAGFGDYFPHRLGHGLGISVHEYPSMAYTNDHGLKEGMVYTVEPGIYLPGVGGVRIEDDVLVTKEGYRTLTKFPKQLQII